MLKIAVCDDDKAAITGLSQAIKNAAHEFSEPVEIHTFSNGNELLNSGSKYNLILLDIEMLTHTYEKNKGRKIMCR